MIQHIRVVLSDTVYGVSALADQSGRAICRCEAATKTAAVDEISMRLICVLESPFNLHIDDRCVIVLPIVKILLEDIATSELFVATAFDSDGEYLCDGACCCHQGAVDRCFVRLGELAHCGMISAPFQVDFEILNPNDDE